MVLTFRAFHLPKMTRVLAYCPVATKWRVTFHSADPYMRCRGREREGHKKGKQDGMHEMRDARNQPTNDVGGSSGSSKP